MSYYVEVTETRDFARIKRRYRYKISDKVK